MHKSRKTFLAGAGPLIDALNEWAQKYRPEVVADHLCFKCGSREEFEAVRHLFEGESAYLYQSVIAGRRIAIIKFTRPLATLLGDIWFLELSDQKPDRSQKSGFDHVEAYPAHGTVEDTVAAMRAKGFAFEKIVRPHHTTYDGSLGGAFKIRLETERLVQKIKNDEMH